MRAWPLLVPLALAMATPAAAQDEDIWDDDPYAAQDETVLAVDNIIGVLLDMPIGRLASSAPNVEFDGHELFALRAIAIDEELTFHYGEEWADIP